MKYPHAPAGFRLLATLVLACTVLADAASAAVTLSATSREFGAGAGTYTFRVDSGATWTASADVPWVTLSRTSGSGIKIIEVNVGPNPSGANRMATITVDNATHMLTQLALGNDKRELWGVGFDNFGQLGSHRFLQTATPIPISPGATDFAAIATGVFHTLLLKADGTLWAVGGNDYGQLGDGTTIARGIPVQVASGVTSIAVGTRRSLFVKTDGTLWAMGDSSDGSLYPDSQLTISKIPVQVATDVASVAAGAVHSLFVKTDGTLWAMGYNGYGQLGDGTTTTRDVPVQVATGVASVVAGVYNSLFVKTDGTLWAMGQNMSGELGDGTTTNRSTPVLVASDVVTATVGAAFTSHSLFVKADGTLWAMGGNWGGQLGDGTTTSRSTPVQVATGVASVSAGSYHSMFVKMDGTLWAMGENWSGQLGDGTTTNRSTPVPVASGVAKAFAGPTLVFESSTHTLFLKVDGTLWGMGRNNYGQLGDGSAIYRLAPAEVASGVAAASAGFSYSLFVRSDGTLWTMGKNWSGELGDGTRNARSIPAQIASGVASVSAGIHHGMFVKTDGTLWAMGDNRYGQLGDGTTTNRSSPVQVASGLAVVAAGSEHSLFFKTDGTLWAMGRNDYGQLGDGTTTQRNTPVQVATGVASVSAGSSHSLFVKTDGTLWAMGANGSGKLGDGTTTSRSFPVQVASGVVSASAGNSHSQFIKADGTLWAMGSNDYGQLGDGTTTYRTIPVQIATSVDSVAAGRNCSMFVKTDGTLWAVGENEYGRLADGTTTVRYTPVQVASGVIAVDARYTHALILTDGSAGAPGNQPSRLVNLSIRTQAGSDAETLIAGFVADGGTGSASLLARAAGPVLASYGVPGVLADPQLAIHDAAAQVQSNDDWSASLAATFAQVGAFSWTEGSKDAAVALSLAPGPYTAVITGVGGGSGVALAEIYDTDNTRFSTNPRLVNVSARSQVGTGDNVMIAGFVVGGDTVQKVLIRAVGPTLATYGVTGTLADPQLAVFEGSTQIESNDDWEGALTTTFAAVGAFPLDAASKDAALLVTLAPGVYTAQVSGVGGETGVALVEIYAVP